MADNIFGFLRKYLGNVGIFSIILAILEKITEDDFVCPCDESYNIAICVLYGAVPAFCCVIYTLCYMDLSPQTDGATQNNSMRNDRNDSTPPSPQTDGATQDNSIINYTNVSTPPSPQTEDGATQNNSMINDRNVSTPPSPQTDGATQEICTCKKVRYSILTVAIWFCLFFLDGRYVACASSTWKGVYTKNVSLGILKWCKPTGNETSVLESQQETLRWMCISQFVGFILMFFIAIYLPASERLKCCGKCYKKGDWSCSCCCCCCCPRSCGLQNSDAQEHQQKEEQKQEQEPSQQQQQKPPPQQQQEQKPPPQQQQEQKPPQQQQQEQKPPPQQH